MEHESVLLSPTIKAMQKEIEQLKRREIYIVFKTTFWAQRNFDVYVGAFKNISDAQKYIKSCSGDDKEFTIRTEYL